MLHDRLAQDLYAEICQIPIIDCHTHVDPRRPAARSLDDILGYHYYTELAHSCGADRKRFGDDVAPADRARAVLTWMSSFDNTTQYVWFLEIIRAFLDFQGERLTASAVDALLETARRRMAAPDWEAHVLRRANIEKVFLTNDFDDPLEGFDAERYVPCLRADDIVFRLGTPEVRDRLAQTAGVEVADQASLRRAVTSLFERFTRRKAKACAISLPPDFEGGPVDADAADRAIARLVRSDTQGAGGTDEDARLASRAAFWILAEHCCEFRLPFDLMIGVNRRVYEDGVHQGQDLFDQRTSLLQFRRLFNAFPSVPFCVSVLSTGQNQELASYAWIFPNVITSGHWWYSNIPVHIERDLRARLQTVPKTKQLGYYSDMYKLEFGLPKYNMFRRILAQVLATDFVRPLIYSETQALELARLLLRDNARRIFSV